MGLILTSPVIPVRALIFGATGARIGTDDPYQSQLEEVFSARTFALEPVDATRDLIDVYQEASTDGWDGYGAKRVQQQTLELAERFLQLLPTTMRPDDVSAEPDGEISFEWRPRPWRVFSVSVGPEGRLTYAGLFGRLRNVHGVEYLVEEIPTVIIDNLARLFSRADA